MGQDDRTRLEDRLRAALRAEAERVEPSAEAWSRIRGRVQRRRWRWAGVALAGAALIVAAALAGPTLLDSLQRQRVEVGGGPSPSPATSPSPTPTENRSFFPGFWPASTWEEAERLQRESAGSPQITPATAAEGAAKFVGWMRIEVLDSSIRGSAQTGWSATVTFRPYVGEGTGRPGTRHTLELIGLKGEEKPVWFATSLRSDNLVVDAPVPGDSVTSPLAVSGRGVGFEATILVEVRDGAGNRLNGRGPGAGFVMGGSTEIAPFMGSIAFDSPGTPAGIVILKGSTGLEGPEPDWTIVRVRFGG